MKNTLLITSLAIALAGCATGPFANTETTTMNSLKQLKSSNNRNAPLRLLKRLLSCHCQAS